MKKRIYLAVCMALTISLTACSAAQEHPRQISDSSGLASVQAESSVRQADAVNQTAEQLRRLPLLSKLQCVDSQCMVLGAAEISAGKMALLTMTGNGTGEKYTVSKKMLMVDIINDRLLQELPLNENDQLLGARQNGQAVLLDTRTYHVRLMNENGDVQDGPTVGSENVCFSREDDCLYTTCGQLQKTDFNGTTATLIAMDTTDRTAAVQNGAGAAVVQVGAVGEFASENSDAYYYSLLDGTAVLLRPNDISSDYCFCGDKVISFEFKSNEAPDGGRDFSTLLCVYSPDRKEPEFFEAEGNYTPTLLNQEGLMAGALPGYDEPDQLPAVLLLDLKSEKSASVKGLSGGVDYAFYPLPTSGVTMAVGSGTRDYASAVYIINPAKAEYTDALQPSQRPKEEEQPVYTCGKHLQEQRRRADELEKKYSVRILLGNEIKYFGDHSGYHLHSLEESDLFFSESEQCASTDRVLQELDEQMSLYGKEFFECFRDFKGEGGLTIVMTGGFEDATENNTNVAAFACRLGGRYYMVMKSPVSDTQVLDSTFHHELWHNTEFRITGRDEKAFDDEEWMRLNAEGFTYTEDSENYFSDQSGAKYMLTESSDKDLVCITSYYSRVNGYEDRATLMEYISEKEPDPALAASHPELADYGSLREFFMSYPHLKDKITYIKKYTDRYFGGHYWPLRS